MFLRYGFALFASILTSATAHAAIYTVGTDDACTHTDIASAAATADAHPGPDTIHVAYNLYNPDLLGQAIAFTANEQVDLVGGFANCSQATSDGNHSTIDGLGGATDPVFSITVGAGGHVRMSYLTIQRGDQNGSEGKGGGIYFTGSGVLELNHTTIAQNTAGNGGGIYAESTGPGAELVIGTDVAIVGNTARTDGGGIFSNDVQVTMTQADSYIANNHAPNGRGGGVFIIGSQPSRFYLGSSGFGNAGAIYLNDARLGGGVAVQGYFVTQGAELHLFTTDPARPVRIKGNTASEKGGGIYFADNGAPYSLWAWNAWIEDNIAPQGAAMFGIQLAGAIAFNDPSHRPAGSVDCPVGSPCGGIVGNAAEDQAAQPTGGVVEANFDGYWYLNRIAITGNTGRYLFRDDHKLYFFARHVAMTDNVVSGSLISTDNDNDHIQLDNTTIAGNTIGDSTVLRYGNDSAGINGRLYRTIIWQPGKTTLHISGDPIDLLDDMVSERSSVDGGNTPYVVQQDPRFVDPAHGDYSLRAGSPAVDRTTSVAGDSVDLYSNPRDVELPMTFNFGVRDLGAIERQTLQPLVLNSDFDADLRLWNTAIAGSTSWDATRNATGAPGSGSAHVTAPSAVTGTQIGGIVQCVHLPGPGTYALNGWGHGTGTMFTAGDIAELYWEYRKSGGENCTGGAPNATGTQVLSNSNSWSRPATPAYIQVTAQDWTYTSSIAVTLVAVENGASGAPTNAWFDGVTLGIEGEDTIFAGSFENP
jgi:predicted outer membrane repeat protein